MKTFAVTLALVASPFALFAGEIRSKTASATAPSAVLVPDVSSKNAPTSQQMKITVGKRVFTATLQNNKAAAAFRALLPLTIDMHDVNRNEKAYDLPSRVPSADANPGSIRTGDLMLWSSRTVVLFYKSFPTSYSYTRLGCIDDPDGFAAALGAGDVTVKFELP
jgi:hypothetical protein